MERVRTLITGGTRGIGAAIARRLAADGHDLVLGYRADTDAAQDVRRGVEALGVSCVLVAADLAEPAGVDDLFSAALTDGPLTGVVNNAGWAGPIGSLADTDVDVVRRVVEINLTAAMLVARAAVLAMARSRGGSGGVLVNISSGAATIGAPGEYVHYAAAKAGLDALTFGLGKEVGADGVRVVGVAPGAIRTRMHADSGDAGRLERIGNAVPLGRPGEPEDIASTVAWLLSDESSYVTATTLRVAGGR